MSTKSAGRSALGVLIAGALIGTAFAFLGPSPGDHPGDERDDDTVEVTFVVQNPTERYAVNVLWNDGVRAERLVTRNGEWTQVRRVTRGTEVHLKAYKEDPHTDLGCEILIDGQSKVDDLAMSPWAAECEVRATAE